MRRSLCLSAAALLLTSLTWARSTGGSLIVANSGAPGDGVCADCHSSSALNSGNGSLRVTAASASYTPGQKITLQITLSDPNAKRWGFQISARQGDGSAGAGTLAVSDATLTQLNNGENNQQFITHRSAGTRPNTTGSSTWEVIWTAPDSAAGPITFYAAGNAANNDGAESGDSIYTTKLVLEPGSATPPTPAPAPTVTQVIPHFQAGDAFSTLLYLANPSPEPAAVSLALTANDGTPLSLWKDGAASLSLTLDSNASTTIEILSAPTVYSGSLSLTGPAALTGYAILRRTSPEGAVQETILPLSTAAAQTQALVWDDTSLTTRLALGNPGTSEASTKITLRDPAGASLASATVSLPPQSKQELNLRDLPEFTMVNGAYGLAEISAAPAAVTVAGFRSGPQSSAFIPAADTTTLPAPQAFTYIVPHYALGDSHSSSLYLTNPGADSQSVKIAFFDPAGQPLAALPDGASSSTLTLPSKGSLKLDTPIGGPAASGYATITAGASLTGYAVVRQTPSTGTIQESFVPLSPAALKTSTLLWDDTNSASTRLNLANPGTAEAAITITLRNPAGAVLATSLLSLPAGAKLEFNLRDRPEFTMVPDARGLAEITTTTGAYSLAAFRTGPASLALIPASGK